MRPEPNSSSRCRGCPAAKMPTLLPAGPPCYCRRLCYCCCEPPRPSQTDLAAVAYRTAWLAWLCGCCRCCLPRFSCLTMHFLTGAADLTNHCPAGRPLHFGALACGGWGPFGRGPRLMAAADRRVALTAGFRWRQLPLLLRLLLQPQLWCQAADGGQRAWRVRSGTQCPWKQRGELRQPCSLRCR